MLGREHSGKVSKKFIGNFYFWGITLSNAVTPRPSRPVNEDVPVSKKTPLRETQLGAMNFDLWKQIGKEFMVKSNINHWITCKEGTGSLVECRAGTLDCQVVKNIAPTCHNVSPDEIRFLTKESSENLGPHLYYSKSSTYLNTYYYWESSTKSPNSPRHEPLWPKRSVACQGRGRSPWEHFHSLGVSGQNCKKVFVRRCSCNKKYLSRIIS